MPKAERPFFDSGLNHGFPASPCRRRRWYGRGNSSASFGHLLLLDLFVHDVAGPELLLDVVQGDAHLDHQDHHVVDKVGDLIDGFLLIAGFTGDNDFCGFLSDLFEDLVDALLKQVGGIGALLRRLFPVRK